MPVGYHNNNGSKTEKICKQRVWCGIFKEYNKTVRSRKTEVFVPASVFQLNDKNYLEQ
jgi:hypothetical protein